MTDNVDSGASESPLKASMLVVLKANDVVVAQVDSPQLWNEVFAAINAGSTTITRQAAAVPATAAVLPSTDPLAASVALNTPTAEPINKFAKELSVDLNMLIGACDPTSTEPYLHLDPHHWESLKKSLPPRGQGALPSIVVASTILCLWARHAGLGTVTQGQAQTVLAELNARDPNPGRGLQGADWLQTRQGGQVVLNPGKISKAIAIAKSFCTQDWSGYKAS